MSTTADSKHAQVYAALNQEIREGRWSPGERVPSEAELVERFGVSRITVSRAMRDLKQTGLVERRPGSGTYVAERKSADALSFGLLIPNLGDSEIFELICQGMMGSPLAGRHALLWGRGAPSRQAGSDGSGKSANAWKLCRQFIERKVAGVFIAPLEHEPDQERINARIARALDKARIPIVLLDRPLHPFPAPSRYDLVGIDNRAAGYILTSHLLDQGCRRVQFASLAGAASTVADREAGFREAMLARGVPYEKIVIHRQADYGDEVVNDLVPTHRPDGLVCANDRTAALLMHALLRGGFRIPADVRLVGIDDQEFSKLLPVPLTTLRQPARRIGDAAFDLMLGRIARPDLPVRHVHLPCELIVRESCGAKARAAA
jgi:GntR family transcriptional regulator, arabinose operon transcriptional repressor